MSDDADDAVKVHWVAFPFVFAKRHAIHLYQRYKHLRLAGKVFIWLLALFYFSLLVAFLVIGPAVVTQRMYNLAQDLRKMRLGWLLLGSIMVVTSLPPMVGFTTMTTLCGFAWRLEGFYLAGPASLIGSAFAFVVLRLLFKKRLKAWSGKNTRWQALEAVIRARGLPLIILIRLCPIPWVYSNAFFASVEAVSFPQFILATLVLMPKIFLHVFIGSRISDLSDGEHRRKMDTTTKVLDIGSVVLAAVLGILTGIYVYRITQAQIKSLKELPSEARGLAADAVDDLEAPLLQAFSDDEDYGRSRGS